MKRVKWAADLPGADSFRHRAPRRILGRDVRCRCKTKLQRVILEAETAHQSGNCCLRRTARESIRREQSDVDTN